VNAVNEGCAIDGACVAAGVAGVARCSRAAARGAMLGFVGGPDSSRRRLLTALSSKELDGRRRAKREPGATSARTAACSAELLEDLTIGPERCSAGRLERRRGRTATALNM